MYIKSADQLLDISTAYDQFSNSDETEINEKIVDLIFYIYSENYGYIKRNKQRNLKKKEFTEEINFSQHTCQEVES